VILPKRPYINPGKNAADAFATGPGTEGQSMIRLFKLLIFLIIVAFVALVGYAYLGNLAPDQSETVEPVQLDG
jgi:hypothetical protein